MIDVSRYHLRLNGAKGDQFQSPRIALACGRSGHNTLGQMCAEAIRI
jgi:hypothetical protein